LGPEGKENGAAWRDVCNLEQLLKRLPDLVVTEILINRLNYFRKIP